MRKQTTRYIWIGALSCVVAACLSQNISRDLGRGPRHGWWEGLGPVIPHETFPADCAMCHIAQDWTSLRDDFAFDHEAETGVRLTGAHVRAQCLRCHNDRGPTAVFDAQGCVGCHEDIHLGQLGPNCTECHQENTWQPVGQIQRHARTRFPLVGVHAATSCHRCHPGAEVGQFVPADTECLTCHADDLAQAVDPDHLALGWVDNCDRCHIPLDWNTAELDP